MTLNWYAKRFNMGAVGSLASLLRDAGKTIKSDFFIRGDERDQLNQQ